MPKKSYGVIIPKEYKIKPAELDAAWILANHYKMDVQVLTPSDGFMQKTADFIISDVLYELKSPITSNIRSIENLVRLATKQSYNVILDLRKTKLTEKRMHELCKERLREIKKLRKIILIAKNKKVLEFTK